MTRKRLRWLAVQSVVVVALAVVVAVTLLKPESNEPLSGIGGTGGNPPTVAQGPSGGNAGGPGGGNNGGNGGGHGGHNGGRNGSGPGSGGHNGGANAPTGTATASAGGSPPIASTAVPESSPTRPEGGVTGETPSDDQYADSLDAIDSALR